MVRAKCRGPAAIGCFGAKGLRSGSSFFRRSYCVRSSFVHTLAEAATSRYRLLWRHEPPKYNHGGFEAGPFPTPPFVPQTTTARRCETANAVIYRIWGRCHVVTVGVGRSSFSRRPLFLLSSYTLHNGATNSSHTLRFPPPTHPSCILYRPYKLLAKAAYCCQETPK